MTRAELKYKVIATGSKGNAVLLGTFLIDCGIPKSHLEDEEIEACYITHRHGDHIQERTIKWLLDSGVPCYMKSSNKRWFKVKFGVDYCNLMIWVKEDTFCVSTLFDIFDVKLTKTEHDVPNYAMNIIMNDDLKIFYATDLEDCEHLEAYNYHYYFIEANYCMYKLERLSIIADKKGVYNRYKRSGRTHLSKQQAYEWVNKQKGVNFIKTIPLHKSNETY